MGVRSGNFDGFDEDIACQSYRWPDTGIISPITNEKRLRRSLLS